MCFAAPGLDWDVEVVGESWRRSWEGRANAGAIRWPGPVAAYHSVFLFFFSFTIPSSLHFCRGHRWDALRNTLFTLVTLAAERCLWWSIAYLSLGRLWVLGRYPLTDTPIHRDLGDGKMASSLPADVEKAEKAPSDNDIQVQIQPADTSSGNGSTKPKTGVVGVFSRINDRIESLSGFEARGITRVLPSERQPPSVLADLQVAILWFGANISANNMTTGLFGPLIFGLGFKDSVLCAVFGCLLGAASTSYMAIWGPQSGNRTMVCLRYFMGYWPSKLPCFLNIVLMVGYITLNFIISGQILSAVSGGQMTVIVGIVVAAVVCWIVAVFGMWFFHTYERLVCTWFSDGGMLWK